VEISVNGYTIILDAGTGIIGLGRSLVQRAREQGRKVSAVLLLSHVHHDHTQGFPFFTPAFIPGTQLDIYGPELLGTTPATVLDGLMQPPLFPVRMSELSGSIRTGVIRGSDVLLVGGRDAAAVVPAPGEVDNPDVVRVRVLRSYAHPGGVVHYRIDWQGRSVVYATDTEGYVSGDQRLANFARGADLLIHDAQYTDEHYLGLEPGLSVTQGFGHSTTSMACQAAISAGVRQLALFHHAPEYSDARLDQIDACARACFSGAFVAREGQELRFPGANGYQLKALEMVERSRK
jgi:ribonuclease BN (tRNA processing enzyme)